jgi:exopolysaccharide biosynthesis polyprenyl glycosylphosphotransferase
VPETIKPGGPGRALDQESSRDPLQLDGALTSITAERRIPWTRHDFPEGEYEPAVRTRDAIYRRALAVADVVACATAILFAVSILGRDRLAPTVALAIPLVILVAKAVGLYDRDEHLLHKSTLDEAPALFVVATLFTLLTWLADGLAVQGQLGRDQVVGLWGLLFVALLLGRAATRRLVTTWASAERCLVLGDEGSAERLAAIFRRSRTVNAEIVAQLPLAVGRRRGESPPEAFPDEPLPVAVSDCGVERVIIAPTSADSDDILNAVRMVKALGVKVSVLPRLFEAVGSSARFDDVDGTTLLGVPNYGLSQSSMFLKRVMDVSVSAGLLAVIAPLLGVIALAIKLTPRGPVLFRQTRIGKDGAQFQMLKFRSMVDGADEQKAVLLEQNEAMGGLFKIAADPRITPVGRLLRPLSLDELPQLVNVFFGHMSLVGPRPLVPDEDVNAEGWQRRRLHVPPGMTGVWQILGSARIPFSEMVTLDYLYGANWSIWLDIKILLRTVPYVLGRQGL